MAASLHDGTKHMDQSTTARKEDVPGEIGGWTLDDGKRQGTGGNKARVLGIICGPIKFDDMAIFK